MNRRATREAMVARCPDMIRLRAGLDQRGIAWRDQSDFYPFADGTTSSGITVFRTRWVHGEEVVTAIWGYRSTEAGTDGITKDWPFLLECYQGTIDARNPSTSASMTVEEILEAYA